MRHLLPLVLLAACTPSVDEFRGVLPDDRLLLDTSGMSRSMRGAGEPSDHAIETLDTANGINELLGDVLGTIEEVTSFPASWERNERMALWGPWTDGGIDGRLWVRQDRRGNYDWAFEFRFEGEGEEAWQAPIAGQIGAGSDDTRSSGGFLIDVPVFDRFGDNVGATGAVALEYTIDAETATGSIALDDFAEESGDTVGDGLMAYTTTAAEGGSIDFVAVADLADPPNGTEETMAVRSRWIADGSGRSDVVITGGEVGVLRFYETDCWDASLSTVFYENSYDLVRSGDAAQCAFADAEYPAE
jgi:hypothetical protein